MAKINLKDMATGAAWYEGLKWVWDIGDGLIGGDQMKLRQAIEKSIREFYNGKCR